MHNKPHSEETKRKISLSKKGTPPWNKGKKLSYTVWNKGKQIQTNTGKTHFKKGQIPWNEGKKMSPEICKNNSLAHIGQTPWNKGKRNYLSFETLKKMSLSKKGKKIKGVKICNDYVFIYMPLHPGAKKYGYIKRANFVIEQLIGRHLKKSEIVHHRGIKFPIGSIENKQDDSPENLKLFANESEHHRYHWPHGFNPKRLSKKQ